MTASEAITKMDIMARCDYRELSKAECVELATLLRALRDMVRQRADHRASCASWCEDWECDCGVGALLGGVK